MASKQTKLWSCPAALFAACALTGGALAGTPIYVTATGNDLNPGTIALPMATIQAAIDTQAIAGGGPVFIGLGVFAGPISLRSGVDVLGGFDENAGWTRNGINATNITSTTQECALGSNVNSIVLDQLNLITTTGLFNQSTYAIRLLNCTDITLSAMEFHPANAGNGSAGSTGVLGSDGGSGSLGQPGCENGGTFCFSCSTPNSGNGGISPVGNNGGNGGRPGLGSQFGQNGSNGIGFGPGIGGPGTPPRQGSACPSFANTGSDGNSGANGADGAGGSSIGVLSTTYIPSNGSLGSDGVHGAGGGGGGGGGGGIQSCDSYGSGGAGGGGGASAGTGGTGGSGGGGNFAVYIRNSSGIIIDNCVASMANAGNGGSGGNGALGGFGGNGGVTFSTCGANYGGFEQDDGSQGARGGNGGNGGNGGSGGGGGGGPVLGIVILSPIDTPIVNTFQFIPGNPGLGGSGTNPGADGTLLSISGTTQAGPVSPDCNNNGIIDIVEIADGITPDSNANCIPDPCEAIICISDVTTTNSNPGEPGYGIPDGTINAADLSYFVENWLNCK